MGLERRCTHNRIRFWGARPPVDDLGRWHHRGKGGPDLGLTGGLGRVDVDAEIELRRPVGDLTQELIVAGVGRVRCEPRRDASVSRPTVLLGERRRSFHAGGALGAASLAPLVDKSDYIGPVYDMDIGATRLVLSVSF